ncbi:MAG: hypothetical protein ACRC8P_01560 [Spiroplasma sp.]
MSQKSSRNNQLISTAPLSNHENNYLLFSFRFMLSSKKLDVTHYKKVLKAIIDKYSNIKIKEFTKICKIEVNDNIISRQHEKNNKFITYLQEKYQTELKTTYDICRENNGMRAYGFLKRNIFYVLEIDPKHESR